MTDILECQKKLNEQNYHPYILMKQWKIYRRISGLETYFARILFKNFNWVIEYGKFPTPRHEVYINDEKLNHYDVITYLKNHDNCVVGQSGGILEPYVFQHLHISDD
ncbi:MAG: hypothetical protein HC836_35545, partial [Richelia sp. RM2_1_2]|nr:hypothetical protein [Richelia sp. RM2_1_2]